MISSGKQDNNIFMYIIIMAAYSVERVLLIMILNVVIFSVEEVMLPE
jgi:hypothetical protein